MIKVAYLSYRNVRNAHKLAVKIMFDKLESTGNWALVSWTQGLNDAIILGTRLDLPAVQ